MALLKCPECGHDMSSLADACPNCGYKLANENKTEYKEESRNTSANDFGSMLGGLIGLSILSSLFRPRFYGGFGPHHHHHHHGPHF